MPLKINAFPEYTQHQIDDMIEFFNDATVVEPRVEDEFELLRKDEYFGLRKDGVLQGLAKVGTVNFFSKTYTKIYMIFILKEYRRSKAATILMHGIKETSDNPLICDDVVSEAGFALLNSFVTKQTVFKMRSLDKKEGTITDFAPGDEKNVNLAIIIENKLTGFYREGFYPQDLSMRMYLQFIYR